MTTETQGDLLDQIYDATARRRWRGLRTEERALQCGREVIEWLRQLGVTSLDQVVDNHIDEFIQQMRRRGNSAATINAKLSALNVMSDVAVSSVPPMAKRSVPRRKALRVPRIEKWWLTPDAREGLVSWLYQRGQHDFADYVEWTCFTGLRVEETLRLGPRHFVRLDTASPSLVVPGTKTASSQSTVPISEDAAAIARRRLQARPDDKFFQYSYQVLRKKWEACRTFLDVENIPTATLKNLRRSFAAHCADRGMPTEMLQRLMRHGTIDTTIQYLHIVGRADLEDSRKYL